MSIKRSLFPVLAFALCAALPVAAQQQAAAKAPATQPARDPVAATFRAWDANHDGNLSLVEFRSGWEQAQRTLQAEAKLHRQFSELDANHDNAIDPAEYGNLVLVKQAGKTAPPLSAFDANHDGKLQFGEYLKLVRDMAPRPANKPPAK